MHCVRCKDIRNVGSTRNTEIKRKNSMYGETIYAYTHMHLNFYYRIHNQNLYSCILSHL
jgi:hypothetical protein